MSNRIRFEGLDELREALRSLPDELTAEAAHIIEAAANGAEAEIKGAYPVRTGNLAGHLISTVFEKGKYAYGRILKNTAKHAWMFENGTQARHTAIGANRGAMPPGHVFIPIVVRKRRQMYEALKDLLQRHGLLVSGDA